VLAGGPVGTAWWARATRAAAVVPKAAAKGVAKARPSCAN